MFNEILDEFEWPSLKACSVGIGLLSFSSIGFIVVLCLLKKVKYLNLPTVRKLPSYYIGY